MCFTHKTTPEKNCRNCTKTFSHLEHSKFCKKSSKKCVRKYYSTWSIDLANKLWYRKILDFILCHQAKFQALLAVAAFMFRIEFWVKNVPIGRAIFSAGGPGGAVRPPIEVLGWNPQKNF